MLVIPALDLRAGRVVRLHRGDFSRERSYSDDPLGIVDRYVAAGARRLHVVDLDAARGRGENLILLERIVREAGVEVQVAGGIRSLAGARRWLESGAAAVVMGTVAVRQPGRLKEVADGFPGRVMAALDVKGGRPAVTGWTALAELTVAGALTRWSEIELAAVVVTSIERDGTLTGPDLALLAEVRDGCRPPVIYSGGIASLVDLEAVAAAGAAGAILGRSLLDGRIPLAEALARSS